VFVLRVLVIGIAVGAAAAQPAFAQATKSIDSAKSVDSDPVARGRYLAVIGGCNDCHTPGYIESAGKVPEKQWLTGSKLGWRGPWGTTYPSNLRMLLPKYTEDQWLKVAKTAQYRPPMPWFALHEMSEQDLRALYRFTKSLGPAGEPAPAYVPPGQEPKGPVVQFPAPPK
jgi:mono/diheme cytochrome c family protein